MENLTASSSHEPHKRPKTTEFRCPTQLLIPFLPDEVSLEILTRVPVKSLIKFTTVSKSWNFHLKSPHFTKLHFSVSLSDPSHTHHYLLYSCQSLFFLQRIPLHSVMHRHVIFPQGIRYPMRPREKCLELVGSINGLVCLSNDLREIVIWNPFLRKFKQLRRPKFEFQFPGCVTCYGFGYDAVGDNYKVVAISRRYEKGKLYETEVMVYSRTTDSWKSIQGFTEGDDLHCCSGISVNGKLHWGTNPGTPLTPREYRIMSIDVLDESCGELDQPIKGEGTYDFILGVIGDCISLVDFDRQNYADFWVMKEYGVTDSWTKFASISYLNEPERSVYRLPLFLLNNGKMLLMSGAAFNQKTCFVQSPRLGVEFS